jgi:hypothetical protein
MRKFLPGRLHIITLLWRTIYLCAARTISGPECQGCPRFKMSGMWPVCTPPPPPPSPHPYPLPQGKKTACETVERGTS